MVLKSRVFAALSFLLSCTFSAHTSFAQTEADFVAAFSGDWLVFDPTYGDQARCLVILSTEKQDGGYSAETKQCRMPLANIAGWKIVDNQLHFVSIEGGLVARLGGNQNRISGETLEDAGLVMERLQAIKQAPVLGCTYRGYTSDCVTEEDVRKPIDSADLSKEAPVRVLVRLNVRSEPRPDAAVVSELEPQTCVKVSQCLAASDGNWCKTSSGRNNGWIVQEAIRLNQWRTLTFSSGC